MVAQKAMRFGPSARRMLARMRPERARVAAVVALAVVGTALFAVGPRILGGATDLIFAGLFGRQLPAGSTRAQAVETVRASGDARLADMLAAMDDLVPGQGVDFEAVGRVLLLVLGLYVAASLLGWLQGYLVNDVVQGTVYRMRAEVEDKINRLPLGYFDRQPRGELPQPGDQRHRQRVAEPVPDPESAPRLATDGDRRGGDDALPLACPRIDRPRHDPGEHGPGGSGHEALAGAVRVAVAAHRRPQRAGRGGVHRARADPGVRPAARHGSAVRGREPGAVRGWLRGAVRLGADHADDDVHREPELRGDRGRRRAAGGDRHDEPGRGPGVHPVLAAVHASADPGGVDGQPAAVGGGFGRAGVRAARRRGGTRRPRLAGAPPSAAGPGRARGACPSATTRTPPLITDLSLLADPGHTVAIVGPTGGGQDDPRQSGDAGSTTSTRAGSPWTA